MQQDNEQGFLSGKFDDWSGEPIPNGWNSIETRIRKEKIRRNALAAVIPAVILLSFFLNQPAEMPFKPADRQAALISSAKSGDSDAFLSSSTANTSNKLLEERRVPEISGESLSQTAGSSSEPAAELLPSPTSSISPADAAGLLVQEEKKSASEPVQEELAALTAGNSEAGFLQIRTPVFASVSSEISRPELRLRSELSPSSHPKIWFNRFITVQAGWTTSSVVLDHSKSENWLYHAGGAGFTKAGTFALGFRLERPLSRTTSMYYGIETGVFARYTELISTSKNPTTVQVSRQSESKYSVSQEFESQKEVRESMVLFVRNEIGLRQAITRRSGVLASAQLWTRLGSKSWSDLDGAAGFSEGKSSFSPGWRLGAWMQAAPFTQLELSYSAMPESLAPSTAGLQFNSSSVSLSLKQCF